MIDSKIDIYIQKQSKEYQEIIQWLRNIIFETFPGIDESYQWGVLAYDHGRFYIAALKKQVNLGFSIVGLDKDEIAQLEGAGKTMRHLKIYSTQDDKDKIIKLLKLVKKKAKCVEC